MPSFYLGVHIRKNIPAKDLDKDPIQPERQFNLLQQIAKGYSQQDDFPKDKYVQQGELFYWKDRIVIPDITDVKNYVISECHDSMFSGHMGKDKTIQTVKRLFWWKNMAQDITEYVKSCHTCQITKAAPIATQGDLHPIETAERPWANISVDLITALPMTTSGHDSIITVVDRCTKMVILIPTDITVGAEEFAQLMLDHVFSKHGLPLDIIHDRDPRFTGDFFTSVCSYLNLQQSMTSAWHPQSDGQTERMNRTIGQVLRAHAAESYREWDNSLSLVGFAMNNSVHASLQQSPFFLNYGYHPITPVMLDLIKQDKAACATALKWTKSNREAFDFAMQQLKMARDRYKSYADSNRKDISFKVGDNVLLSTVNLNKHSLNRKLFPKYLGPFKITEVINETAYRLDLPAIMKIHNAFHVSLLRKYIPGKTPPPPPIPIEIEGELEFEVERILLHREKSYTTGKPGNKKTLSKKEYYIKWAGYGIENATWEPESHLRNAKESLQDYWETQEQLRKAAELRPRSKQTLKRLEPDVAATASKRSRKQ